MKRSLAPPFFARGNVSDHALTFIPKMGILILLLAFYIGTGIFFCIYYCTKEGRIADWKEFWLLFFFPSYGLGNWKFNHEKRYSPTTEFPKQWYLWKNAITVHWIFLVAIAITGLFSVAAFNGMGMDAANHQDNQIGAGLEFIGTIFMTIIFLVIAFLGLGSLFLIFIFIPRQQVKSIESEVYRKKYLDEKAKNKQHQPPTPVQIKAG